MSGDEWLPMGSKRTFMAVMSMTCHFMRGRMRRFLRIMAATTDFTKSMLVMSLIPSSYLHPAKRFIRLWI